MGSFFNTCDALMNICLLLTSVILFSAVMPHSHCFKLYVVVKQQTIGRYGYFCTVKASFGHLATRSETEKTGWNILYMKIEYFYPKEISKFCPYFVWSPQTVIQNQFCHWQMKHSSFL
jgi:hypothetical protein